MKKHYLYFLLTLLLSINGYSQEEIVYKQIDSTELFMQIYFPKELDTAKKYPAMVIFFGGGWNGGSTEQFKPHAEYFSSRGLVCFLVDYRVKSRQKTTPFESVKDAKSAMRYIRENAANFNIDENKLIAAGGSAGGHLAAATALIEDYNEESDNLAISCKPNALVLFNPVIDNGPGGYGYERIGNEYKNFSPLHNIKNGAPPTIIFLGTKDDLIPVETAQYYKTVMEKVKGRCDLHLYDDQVHGFFNLKNYEYYKNTVSKSDDFLQSLGYLNEMSLIDINHFIDEIHNAEASTDNSNAMESVPNLKSFTILKEVEGDLDQDGIAEKAIVYDTEKIVELGTERQIHLFKHIDNEWVLWKTSIGAILPSQHGGMMGDPFEGISIEENKLVINHFGGSRQKWNYTHEFKLEGDQFQLIGTTVYFGSPCDFFFNFDYNLLNGKVYYEEETENCEENSSKIVIKEFTIKRESLPIMDGFYPGENGITFPNSKTTVFY